MFGLNFTNKLSRKAISKTLSESSNESRIIGNRGYDVIENSFFAEEILQNNHTKKYYSTVHWFNDFKTYHKYVDGRINENSCYYKCSTIPSKYLKNLDMTKESFINTTETDYSEKPTSDEIKKYNEGELFKEKLIKCSERIKPDMTGDEIYDIYSTFIEPLLFDSDRSFPSDVGAYWWFLLHRLIFADNAEENIPKIMEFISHYSCYASIARELCMIFNPEIIYENYNYIYAKSSQEKSKQKRRLKRFANAIINKQYVQDIDYYFDKKSNLYVERKKYKLTDKDESTNQGYGNFSYHFCTYRFFVTFEEFVAYKYKENDLRNTDLSDNLYLNIDPSKYVTDKTTILPVCCYKDLRYSVIKEFDKKTYKPEKFHVRQMWINDMGTIIKSRDHYFMFFFDFVHFLNKDLSDADLLDCVGLENLIDISDLSITNARIPSQLYNKFHLPEQTYDINKELIKSFSESVQNEELSITSTSLTNHTTYNVYDFLLSKEIYVSYISDIHLLHRLVNENATSESSIYSIIDKTANTIADEAHGIILICGDVSSDFKIFSVFCEVLSKRLGNGRANKTFFVLGNHELWDFENEKLDTIIDKYKKLISKYGMHLINNCLYYKNKADSFDCIEENQLRIMSTKEISSFVSESPLIIFGGIGFSGYNNAFNADNGIYRNTVNRAEEIRESKRFEDLYNKVNESLSDNEVIIATHMPLDCWNSTSEYKNGYIYVSGHTHYNTNHIKDYKIYADNQIGYGLKPIHMKYFVVNKTTNPFSSYSDGIYIVSPDDYKQFWSYKRNPITYNRSSGEINMLKKNNYFCFIYKSPKNVLSIMNGGNLKRIGNRDLSYYYDNMDNVIEYIKNPIKKYGSIQETISREVMAFGGSGNIHGSIVDIDLMNHIYINPYDMKITGYWAESITKKVVYPSVQSLLEEKRPDLMVKYKKIVKGKQTFLIGKEADYAISDPKEYTSTDIYSISNLIKKMQKIEDYGVLTVWYDSFYKLEENIPLLEG